MLFLVRHIVFWNLKENAEGGDKITNADRIKSELEALVGQIDGLLKAEVNMNYNPNGFDICLYSEFSSRESLDFYQNHPLHLKVKDFVQKVVTQRVVTDSEIL